MGIGRFKEGFIGRGNPGFLKENLPAEFLLGVAQMSAGMARLKADNCRADKGASITFLLLLMLFLTLIFADGLSPVKGCAHAAGYPVFAPAGGGMLLAAVEEGAGTGGGGLNPSTQELKEFATYSTVTSTGQQSKKVQAKLQMMLRDGAFAYIDGLNSLACSRANAGADALFSLGDKTRFRSVIGNSNNSTDYFVYLSKPMRGNPPCYLNKAYYFGADMWQRWTGPDSEKDTFWHEMNHALLEKAALTRYCTGDYAGFKIYLATGGVDDDGHHLFVEGVAQAGRGAYTNLRQFETALRECALQEYAITSKGGRPGQAERDALYAGARQRYMVFNETWKNMAPLKQADLDLYRSATGIFFSPPERVAEFYRKGGLKITTPQGEIPIMPPESVFETSTRLPAFVVVKEIPGTADQVANNGIFSAHREYRFTWASMGEGFQKTVAHKNLSSGRATIKLENPNGAHTTLRLTYGGRNIPGAPAPGGPSTHLFVYEVADTHKGEFARLTFSADTGKCKPGEVYKVRITIDDTRPPGQMEFSQGEAVIVFTIPPEEAPKASVTISGEKTAEPGKTVSLTARVAGDPAVLPRLRLKWTDETRGRPMGSNTTATFAADSPGEYRVKAEVLDSITGKEVVLCSAVHSITVEKKEASPTPTPSTAADVDRLTITGPREVMLSDFYTLEAKVPSKWKTAPSKFAWNKTDYTCLQEGPSSSLKAQMDFSGPRSFKVKAYDASGKYIDESEPFYVNQIPAKFSLTLFGGSWIDQQWSKPESLGFRCEPDVKVDEKIDSGNGSAHIFGHAGGGLFSVRWMGQDDWKRMGKASELPKTHRAGDFEGNGTYYIKGSVGFMVETKADSFLWANSGGQEGGRLSSGLYAKYQPLIEKRNRQMQNDLASTGASIRITRDQKIGRAPGSAGDSTQPGSQAKVKIVAPKTKLSLGEKVEARAVVENVPPGEEPFKYGWTGEYSGKGDRVTITPSSSGKKTISVSVSGASKPVGSASLEYEVAAIKVAVTRLSPPAGKVSLGVKAKFQAKVEGAPAPGSYVFQWQPHPEVEFTPQKGASAAAEAVFKRPGKAKVWVAVTDAKSGATLAESEPVELEVTGPILKISLTPPNPYVGQTTKAALSLEPPSQNADVRWTTPDNVKVSGQSKDTFSITFQPRDTKPAAIKAAPRVTHTGDSLGEIEERLTARYYPVKVSVLGTAGFKAKDAKPGPILTDQYVTMKAMVTPAPESAALTYKWKLNPGSSFAGGDTGDEVRASRSEPGECGASVEVFDSNGFKIGEGAASFAVTGQGRESKKADAAKNLKEAEKLIKEGKLAEAGALVEQAAKNDPPGAKTVGLTLSAEAKKKAWDDFGRADFGSARKHIGIAVRFNPADEDARKKQTRIIDSEKRYRELEAMLPGYKALLDAGKLQQAHRKLLEMEKAHNSFMRGVSPLQEKMTKMFHDRNKEYQDYMLAVEARISDCFKNYNWKGQVEICREALSRWEHSLATEKGLRASLAQGEKLLLEQNAAWDQYLSIKRDYESGKLGDSISSQRAGSNLLGCSGRFGDNDPRKQQIYDLRNTILQGAKTANDPDWCYREGLKALIREDFKEALKLLDKAVSLSPGNGDYRRVRAAAHMGLKDYPKATSDLNEALRINPKDAAAYHGSGILNETQGNYRGAVDDYRSCLKYDPNDAEARKRLESLLKKHPELADNKRPGNDKPSWGQPRGERITGKSTAESVYRPLSKGNPFNGGAWCNSKNGSDWLQLGMDGLYRVDEIRIGMACTDVTTKGARIVLKVLNARGTWETIDTLVETNINREQLSHGGRGNSIPSYRKVFNPPLVARSLRLEFAGHGWFGAEDIQVYGRKIGFATIPNNAGPPTKPPTSPPVSPPTKPPAGMTVMALFENRSSQKVHIFAQGDSFGPHNRLAPGERRQVAVAMPSNGMITFYAGRNGQVLSKKVWTGDPDHLNRYPRVTFTQQERLSVVTGLK